MVRRSLNLFYILCIVQELPEVVNDILLEMEEKDALLLQYDRDRQQLQAQIHEQVCVTIILV